VTRMIAPFIEKIRGPRIGQLAATTVNFSKKNLDQSGSRLSTRGRSLQQACRRARAIATSMKKMQIPI
jgi:hypothetical protein